MSWFAAMAAGHPQGDDRGARLFVERSTRMTHSDPRALAGAMAIAIAAVRLGGDTDTVAAIAGGLAGAAAGAEGVPRSWLRGLWEQPRSLRWMERLAARLTATFVDVPRTRPGPLPLFWPALLLRNFVFMVIVLGHGFARLWPGVARLRAGTNTQD